MAASYPQKMKPIKLGNKLYKPPAGPWFLERKDLRAIYVHECAFTEDLKPVCPICGVYNFRTLDYGYTPENKKHMGEMYYIGVCLTHGCGTVYRYYRPRALRGD